MIFGTGVDLVEIARIQKSLKKYSGRFEEKVFTPNEIAYCQAQPEPGRHFAARFAVKEAVSKCLGSGINGGLAWKDMEVVHHDSGRPILKLTGKGKEFFDRLHLKHIHISISHDKAYAIAHAIAEK